MQILREDVHEHDGKLFVFRDIPSPDGKRWRCQYGVSVDDTTTKWFDCPEGSSFADVQPYGEKVDRLPQKQAEG